MKKIVLISIALLLAGNMMSQGIMHSRALWGSVCGNKNVSNIADYQQHINKVLLSWRMLPGDDASTAFDLYRKAGTDGVEEKIASSITGSTCYQDLTFDKSLDNTYRLTYAGSSETIGSYRMPAAQIMSGLPYISIPLQPTDDVCDNAKYKYQANDCSVGDLDGDGQMEIVVKRLLTVWDENSGTIISDGTGAQTSPADVCHIVIWDAYKLDGTLLWRLKSGPNIILGNSSNFAVADLDGDGRCEMITKTGEGTVFGDGTEIGDTNGDGTTDYRTYTGGWVDHYTSDGPEFFSVIDGATGRELARADFISRSPNSESWGDDYWKRANSLRLGVASFDGEHLSIFLGRGVYARTVVEGWDYSDGGLVRRFHFDSSASSGANKDGKPNSSYAGQGNHSFSVADLDGDGRDEVMYGSMAIDDDGSGLWSTGLGHGDAQHVGKFLPDREGLQVYHCLESGKTMVALHDAKDGGTIWAKTDSKDNDMGRCCVADIDPDSPGCEFWWYGSHAIASDGVTDLGYKPHACNMVIWFDGTLTRQHINKDIIHSDKYGRVFTMYRYDESFNNGTKSNPGWYGDMLGDWREEVILPDQTKLADIKVFSTWYPTTHKFPWLMTDHTYLMSAINENVGYNQPTHTGYYLGSDLENDAQAWMAGGYMATSVKAPTVRTAAISKCYNLMGQEVSEPCGGTSVSRKGVYIRQGKKFIVR